MIDKMNAINKLTIIIVLMFASLVANAAASATSILDKTAAAYKSCGDVKIGFTISVGGNSSNGIIKLSGQKFCCTTGGNVAWFDGKTMWNYVKDNDEVNVTNPSDKDLARINPYAFLSIYKKGYKCVVSKTTSSEYHITMTGKKGSAYKTIVVHLNKSNYQLTYAKMVSAKRTIEISVNSYSKNLKFPASDFSFSKREYPNAEIVDLR